MPHLSSPILACLTHTLLLLCVLASACVPSNTTTTPPPPADSPTALNPTTATLADTHDSQSPDTSNDALPLGSHVPKVVERPVHGVLSSAFNLLPTLAETGYTARPANPTCIAPPRPRTGDSHAQLTPAFDHLRFAFPISMAQTPWSDDHWVVIEREGKIFLITGEHTARTETEDTQSSEITAGPERVLWLDLTPVTFSRSLDSGLLGLAFHPRFNEGPEYRWVFFSYMTGSKRKGLYSVISRWRVNPDNTIDAKSEVVVLKAEQPGREHNGGHIAFGLDGYLYIGFGDGRLGLGGGEPSQRKDSLMGKMLRIDPDKNPANTLMGKHGDYAIPADNPFLGESGTLPEIYALGLRNPWQFSFDRAAGTLWLGDVGAANFEEIDHIKPGGNYGWNLREGSKCNWGYRCKEEIFTNPIFEYTHEEGRAITGGFVYHGTAFPGLVGKYIFGDFGSGQVWALVEDLKTNTYEMQVLLESRANPSSFGQARSGELYLVHHASETGRIFRIDPAPTEGKGDSPLVEFPKLLSQTGCVETGDPRKPVAGMIPYDINAPFWSDGAKKARWFAVPDGTHITANADGRWEWPLESVTLKHFWLFDRLIETRLFVRHTDGEWGAYTYIWNDAQTDAALLETALTKTYEGEGEGGATEKVDWYYPSRAQCMMCHTGAAGRVLGLESVQMKRITQYPSGVYAGQLETLTHIGVLEGVGDIKAQAALASPWDEGGALEDRARAYLHTNCASCHRPDGADRAKMDLRITTPIGKMGVCEQEPELDTLGITNARLLAAGEPDRSLMVHRASRRDVAGMPPIGSLRVDEAGVLLLREWIDSVGECPKGESTKKPRRPRKPKDPKAPKKPRKKRRDRDKDKDQ